MNDDLDQFAAAYGDDFPHALDNQLILNWYPRRVIARARGKSMLELGLGHGHTAKVFSERFEPYTIIEGSAAIIRQASADPRIAKLDICHAQFEDFHCDRRFDNINMGFVLEHVRDPGMILRRYREFIAPCGAVFVSVPNGHSLHRRIGKAAGLLDDLEQLSESDKLLGHQRLFSVEGLSRLSREQGYRIVHTEGIFLKPFTTNQLKQLDLSPTVLEGLLKVGVDFPELCAGILMELRVES